LQELLAVEYGGTQLVPPRASRVRAFFGVNERMGRANSILLPLALPNAIVLSFELRNRAQSPWAAVV